jgi:hypothetical protein
MISCPYCSTQNPEGALYCDECGANLKSTAALGSPAGTNTAAPFEDVSSVHSMFDNPVQVEPIPAYAPPASKTNLEEDDGPDTGFNAIHDTSVGDQPPAQLDVLELPEPEKSPEPPAFLSAAQTVVAGVYQPEETVENAEPAKNVHATLTIERGSAVGTVFSLTNDESYIGRWDADNGVFPDIDLDTHDPEAKVSRRHARIVLKDGSYSLEDLGSTNGTFINRGRRLLPGNANLLNEGDEIIIGKTFMRFHIGN